MDLVTRRKFLLASGVVGGTALAAGAGAFTLGQLMETTSWKRIGGSRTLVLITLYGGNDGLATVIPYADKAYPAARGELAYTADQVLRLDDAMGLNPALKNFKKQFDAGRLATGGDGVGKLPDGRTVFVPRTAPGDLVELARLREQRRFARARPGRLVEASPDRVVPRCPHYEGDECGVCQLQHLRSVIQWDARRGFVGDALRRIARGDVADPPITPAPIVFDYRSKITLAVSVE